MILIDAINTVYSIERIKSTMTVAELIEHLQQYDEDEKVILRFDEGYTYGEIIEDNFSEE